MEFSWALQHQSNDQSGRNHSNDHHEDVNIITQVSARRLLSVTGNYRIICINGNVFSIFLYYISTFYLHAFISSDKSEIINTKPIIYFNFFMSSENKAKIETLYNPKIKIIYTVNGNVCYFDTM